MDNDELKFHHGDGYTEHIKGELTQIFNLPSVHFTIPVHYVGTSFRTESWFISNKLTKINIKSCDNAGKNQS